MLLDQPELKCRNGHIIPANKEVVRIDKYGDAELNKVTVGGVALTNSRIVCEECARAAGGTITRRLTDLKGRALESVGQQTMAETMGEIPMIYIK